MSKPWTFAGIDRSHFSAKLRPALRYKQVHHVELMPDLKDIRRRTGVAFVPVLVTPDDEMLQDTTDIIDELERRMPSPALLPQAAAGRVLCRLFELYADEFFPMVSMRTRWAYPENVAEMQRAFVAFTGSIDAGAGAARQMSSYLPVLGVTEATIPAIDAHTDAMLAALCAHLRAHPYVLGERMSLADCALMGPLYAHFYLDRVTRRKLYDEAIEVCMWIERCNRPDALRMGDWFAGVDSHAPEAGDWPPTLHAILALIGADAGPMLLALEAAFDVWAATSGSSGMELPRGAGPYTSALRGTQVTAVARTYVPWKMQRLRDAFDAAGEPEQAALAAVLSPSGCAALLAPPARTWRLAKRAFNLVLE